MDTNINQVPPDESRFDRLVDGELNEPERREFLARLDTEPGGWRRCALAFLEAQCWKREVGSLLKRETPAAATPLVARPRQKPWIHRIGEPLALAASVVVAMWIGATLQRMHAGAPDVLTDAGGVVDLANNSPPPRIAPSRLQPASSSFVQQGSPLVQRPENPWRVVTVSAPAGANGAGTSFNLPAVEGDNLDPRWPQNLPPPMPDDVLQAFNRTGHQVQQHRELMPIPLNDGRQLVVPVDQVEVKYVPHKSY